MFLRTRVYHVEGMTNILLRTSDTLLARLRSDGAKDFITPVTHHAALPMQPNRHRFIIEMAIVLHLLFLIVIFVILPNYRMVNYDSIFNLV